MIIDNKMAEAIAATKDVAAKEGKPLRLFLDMDGMLAEYRPFVRIEQYAQKGYFETLKPNMNMINAIKLIKQLVPNLEVYTLSAYYDTPGTHAVEEKNKWLDKYLPEISQDHRIYTLCGEIKQSFIKGGISKYDILVDDYTENLMAWIDKNSPYGCGRAVKLLNGHNNRNKTWEGSVIAYDQTPESICAGLLSTIFLNETVKQEVQTIRLLNDVDGKTMYIPTEKLKQLVENNYPEFETVEEFMKNLTPETWNQVHRFFIKDDDVMIESSTNRKLFKNEMLLLRQEIDRTMARVQFSAMEEQIDETESIKKIVEMATKLFRKYGLLENGIQMKKAAAEMYVEMLKQHCDKMETIAQDCSATRREAVNDAISQIAQQTGIQINEQNNIDDIFK